jgi:hypothetical protein
VHMDTVHIADEYNTCVRRPSSELLSRASARGRAARCRQDWRPETARDPLLALVTVGYREIKMTGDIEPAGRRSNWRRPVTT